MSYPSAQRTDHLTGLHRMREQLQELSGIEFERKDLAISSRFPEAPGIAVRIFATAAKLGNLESESVPSSQLVRIVGSLGRAVGALAAIRDWDGNALVPAGQTPQQAATGKRNELMTELDAAENDVYGSLLLLLPTALGVNEAEEAIRRSKEAAENAEGALRRINEVEAAAREATTSAGVSAHAQFFKERAEAHGAQAARWLGAIVATSIGAAFLAWWLLTESLLYATGGAQSFGPFAIMTVTLSGAVTVVLWTTRMYRVHLHNAVVNQHRDDALRTFRAFVEGVQDDAQLRNAVLMQATQCVFQPQETGYGGSGTPPPPQVQLLEFIKSADK